MNHPCEIIYKFSEDRTYGSERGVCRITGKQSSGMPFDKWVKKTFTDYGDLKPGDIISNEALFCFDEASEVITKKTGKEKTQRFRTYTHIVSNNKWYVYNKSQKEEIYKLLIESDPDVCVISDSGQKHLLFKHKLGTWQFENIHISRDKNLLKSIKELSDELLINGFSKTEIITGDFLQHRVMKYGVKRWFEKKELLDKQRGSGLFDLAIWLSTKKETK